MKIYKVKQVAQLAGISVRALHHYDKIGLLHPAFVGENNYRFYTRDELVRLQHILFFKDMGLSLAEISKALDKSAMERATLLMQHREKLAQESRRQLQLLKTIDRTIAELNGVKKMKTADLYKGFPAQKQGEYEAWLIENYGKDMRQKIDIAQKKLHEAAQGDVQGETAHRMAELADIEGELILALESGILPDDPTLTKAVERHHKWIAKWWDKMPDKASYEGLGDLYQNHPDFVARYEALAPGFSQFLVTAMKAYAAKHLS